MHMGWSMVNVLLLILPLFGSSWAWAQFHGFGLGSMWVRVSMTHFTATIECKKNIVEDVICEVAKKLNGKKMDLASTYQFFCQPYFAPAACETATLMYWNSFVLISANVTASALQFLGCAFLFYYWNFSHLGRIRAWSVTLMFGSLIVATTGLSLWTALCPQLSSLPAMWTNTAYGLTGNHVIRIQANNAILQYGSAWALACLGILSMLASLGFFSCMVHAHEDEAAADLLETLAFENARDQATASAVGFDYQGQQPVVAPGIGSW